MPPRGRPVTLSDADLLQAAHDVFLAHGLDATTAEIARRVRISESVIFHRYKTKEALLLAVIERQIVLPRVFAELPARVGRGAVAEHLEEVGLQLIGVARTVLPFMMMACSSPKLNLLRERAKTPHPIRVQMLDLLSQYFDAEIAASRLRPSADPRILARAFLGGINDYVMSDLLQQTASPREAPTFLRSLVDILLHGAVPPKAARPRNRLRRTRS
jgi:AcrR family transcriptional regulator